MHDSARTGPYQPEVSLREDLPPFIGRYRVDRLLGEGGFGRVYLAHDDQLGRPVAVKVPHPRLVSRADEAGPYLAEARTVAQLDHPHIVPVFDVGSSADHPFFVVSKFIAGRTLAGRLKSDRPAFLEAAALVARVAQALHTAHRQGIVHRDVKPGNILLDAEDNPFVADFGLALREADFGKGPTFAGTPLYMSPEQARGEGHRVDGRSDIFSLGVVLYELLTGRRPFRGETREELLQQITTVEARPPRQVDDAIPKELERICLKALAKRAFERYTTAKDLADDLGHFLARAPAGEQPALHSPVAGEAPAAATPGPSSAPTSAPLQVVPKGLRSFDAGDADFFLELLPGARDRDGLPESIRFWKSRTEETDPDNTFSVGLLYGPSGCGKSSLVKAGLLPRLAGHVLPVYVEAAAEDTEARLLKGLRKRCPALTDAPGLKQSLAALRRGQGLAAGEKVVLFLDQFEQWLHGNREGEHTELVQALRQCDGGRVQCLILVRDDFWLAVSRLMASLEVDLVPHRNLALVDLFDVRHARKVLAAYGRAFGTLPEGPAKLTADQASFLDQAVAGLAQDGKVIPVRLALFAEMVKGKAWTPRVLREVGGMEGVGVAFLEEAFAAAQYRPHQRAAQGALKALLPEAGSDIKGTMRAQDELLAASGYGGRPADFAKLLRILDGELRLITPTDPESADADGDRPPAAGPGRFYQLTHDYLVPSLRAWLTRKQKETRRGRAELRLAERAAAWTVKPENHYLPASWEWLNIRLFSRRHDWTASQRQMMQRAGRHHALRGALLAAVLALVGWGGYEALGTLKAHALRDRLLDAATADVPTVVADMAPYRRWLGRLLRTAQAEAEVSGDARRRLHTSLALLPEDPGQVDYLYGRLLEAEPQEVTVLRDALTPHQDLLLDQLWAVAEKPPQGHGQQRLRAACALASYDPGGDRWAGVCGPVAEQLVGENPFLVRAWTGALRPVKDKLLPALAGIFRDRREERAPERTLVARILADFAADQPAVLAELLLDADAKQFAVVFPGVARQRQQALPRLTGELDRTLPAESPQDAREKLAKRQVNAAAALLRLGQAERAWPLLKHCPDPRVRSYLIHRLGPLGIEAEVLVKRLAEEPDVTVRRALLLSLGAEEFGEDAWTPEGRRELVRQLQELYRAAADPGLHGAAEWLLRQAGQEAWLAQTDAALARDRARRDQIKQELAPGKPQWYVNGQGQTMVVIPGPVEFLMGSPPTEAGRSPDEDQHRVRIRRSFAVAAKPVTTRQYLRFRPEHDPSHVLHPNSGDCPVSLLNWLAAAAYCNWLSEQEGIPKEEWCYETDANGRVTRLREGYLSRTGYRLLTGAEWEYACRAGAVTSRSYGETEELLGRYGWYIRNADFHCQPVGRKKPNDLGLFDFHGNAWCWCQDTYRKYPGAEETVEDREEDLSLAPRVPRTVRGGSFSYPAESLRSAGRVGVTPGTYAAGIGFRPARTFR